MGASDEAAPTARTEDGFGAIFKAVFGTEPTTGGPPFTHTFSLPVDPWENWQEGDPEPEIPSGLTMGEWRDGDWWWLSFCDPNRPAGQQSLGVAIVRPSEWSPGLQALASEMREVVGHPRPADWTPGDRGLVGAISMANRLKLNPGGEVAGVPIPADHVPDLRYRNRLLTRAEADEAGRA